MLHSTQQKRRIFPSLILHDKHSQPLSLFGLHKDQTTAQNFGFLIDQILVYFTFSIFFFFFFNLFQFLIKTFFL